MELQIGRITATHPESGSVDAILPIDGRRLTNVRVLSSSASSCSGSFNLPSPSLGKNKNKDVGRAPLGGLEMQGIFGLTEGGFVCLGFVWPHNSQMLFKDKNRSINRHPSGVYSTIDENGNTEFYHPSGAYIRIGSSEAHEDLSGKDRDGSWKIGGASAGYIAVVQAGGKAKLTVKPDGQIDIESAKDINIKSSQEVNIIGTAINFTMGGTTMRLDGGHAIVTTSDISFTGNAQVYGDMKVNGDFKVDGSVKASGGITEHTGV